MPAPDAPIPDISIEENPDGEGNILTGIPISADGATNTAADVLESVAVPEGMELTLSNAEGEELNATAPVGTGCVLSVVDAQGNTVSTVTVVVKGDVLGTGLLDIGQLTRLAQDLNGTEPLTGVYRDAAQLSGNSGSINIVDLVILATMLRDA